MPIKYIIVYKCTQNTNNFRKSTYLNIMRGNWTCMKIYLYLIKIPICAAASLFPRHSTLWLCGNGNQAVYFSGKFNFTSEFVFPVNFWMISISHLHVYLGLCVFATCQHESCLSYGAILGSVLFASRWMPNMFSGFVLKIARWWTCHVDAFQEALSDALCVSMTRKVTFVVASGLVNICLWLIFLHDQVNQSGC